MFENPLMLAGLGGAVVPLVIHLLGRARYRTLDWGAMMFLDAATPPWRDGGRLREYALLGVRMAAVGLLAVALARPVAGGLGGASAVTTPGAATAAEDRAAVAIVVDCSASMAYAGVGRSRMDEARSAALQVISTLRRGDRVTLIVAGAPAGIGSVPLTGDLQAVAARVAELKPAADPARLDEALDAALDAFARQDRATRQLYVITDQQAQSWRGVDDTFIAVWAARTRQQPLAQFVVIPVGGREVDNVSVSAIEVLNPPVVRGLPARIAVTVRNHGLEARGGLPLTLRVGGGGGSVAATVNVQPMDATTITLPITFARAGPGVLTAEVRDAGGGSAGPPADDRRDHVVNVAASLRTLIVRNRAGDGERTFDAAIAPYRAARRDGPDLATIETVAAPDWDAAELAQRYDVVVLDDVVALDEAQATALEQFVYGGGGLLLAPGAASQIDEYNRLLYRDENGLMPGLLQPAATPPQPLTIEPSTIEWASPVMGFLSRDAAITEAANPSSIPGAVAPPRVASDGPAAINLSDPATSSSAASAAATATGALGNARIERYFPLTGRTPAAHVLAAFSSGDAFLVEQPFGGGRVAMVTCSLGPDWSTLPLTNLYLPLAQSTARYLASGRMPTLNFNAGDEAIATIAAPPPPGPAAAAAAPPTRENVIVVRPDGGRERCDVAPSDNGGAEIRYPRTDLPGVYSVRVMTRSGGGGAGAERTALMFSVATDPAESDLTPLSAAHGQRLEARLGFTRVPAPGGGDRALTSRLGDARSRGGGGEYWMMLVAGVLGLFVVEIALTRYWAGSGS